MKTKFQKPICSDIGIIAIVPEVWEKPWQSRHHILSRLSKYFNILWYTPTREWRDFYRTNNTFSHKQFINKRLSPSFHVYSASKWLPRVHNPKFLSNFLSNKRLKQVDEILSDMDVKKRLLYLWRPHYQWSLNAFDYDVSCYHIDDEYSWSTTEQPIDDREKEVITSVDQVIIHSPALMEKKGGINKNTIMVPNGVDYQLFSSPVDEPNDIKDIPHPRIGYIGYIKSQLDFELLIQLARHHQDKSFLFVGPRRYMPEEDMVLMRELFDLPNVHYIRWRPVDELPAYAQAFDICTMCYRRDEYTKFIYPLKVHEYFATGKPVIGSKIASLELFNTILQTAGNFQQWSEAIDNALLPENNTVEKGIERQTIAREHDWNNLAKKIALNFAKHFGDEYVKKIEHAIENEFKNMQEQI